MTGRYTDPHEHLPREAGTEANNDLLWFNTTTGRWELATPTDVVTGVSHGVLSGLGADDHLQYLLIDGTRAMTGPLLAVAGTVLLPGLAFSGDPNTGVWSPGADTVALSTAGAERLRITSTGFVGIGTGSPSVDVEVRTTGNPVLRVRGTSAGSASAIQVLGGASGSGSILFGPATNSDDGRIIYGIASRYMSLWTADVERIRIDSAGKVGIGTTIPISTLEVRGDIASINGGQGNLYVGGIPSSGTGLRFHHNSVDAYIDFDGNMNWRSGSGTNFMHLTSAGNLGIGVSPTYRLHILESVSGDCIRVEGGGSFGSGGRILFGDPTLVYLEEDVDDFLRVHAQNGVRLTTNGTASYSGVNILSPLSTFDIAGSRGAQTITIVAGYFAGEDDVILSDASAGPYAVTLPTAALTTGRVYHIKKIDASGNAVTVTPGFGETIDGAAAHVLGVQYARVEVVSDGANWYIID